MSRLLSTTSALILCTAGAVSAETQISLYGGWQTSPHSRVTGTLPAGVTYPGSFSKSIGWDGKSFTMPPYYGARVTFWQGGNWGWGVELSHDKAYAGSDMSPEFTRLEFTDGHNILTVNYMKRWPGKWDKFTPYVGAGVGIAVPHVDITPAGGQHTYEYQYTGPAARLTAGASYQLNDRWGLFGEYQFTISDNDVDLTGGGDLHTRIITNALNVGVSFAF
ncbi:outer membrane protein [Thalassovita aquimarina]|uniref:Outer membrane beta-barrel protein n=1 Tax=Thalassovita aquimarina TaxID=2785917 RepID=A0ABS5HMS6_9RHOB|nr:outer membrane beta-barrel protein [Thalassovita aquimarina]MBR9650228.1 outer membrane beta-barrel protein [Thalassovita aquimarina]